MIIQVASTFFAATTLLILSISAVGDDGKQDPHSARHILRLEYDIFVGGFRSGHIDLSVRWNGDQYQLFAITSSVGLIDYLVGFRSYAQSRGTISDDDVRPLSHHVNNLWTGDIRFVRMGYIDPERNHEGPVYTVIHPPPVDDDREIVPEVLRRDTIDPLSAALQAAYSAMKRGDRAPCRDTIPVFDGRRRYNLHFDDAGAETVEGPYFTGPARKCLASIERIVGFSSNPFLPRTDDSEGGEIWFADLVPGWPPIPVRFKTDVGLGNAIVHLMSNYPGTPLLTARG